MLEPAAMFCSERSQFGTPKVKSPIVGLLQDMIVCQLSECLCPSLTMNGVADSGALKMHF